MPLSHAEWKVMNALWQQSPATVREVLERLPEDTEWAYTTVKTILTRLADKGIVRQRKRGNASVFTPVLSRRKARHGAVRTLINRAFDGTFGTLVHHLVDVERLSARDRKRLRDLLDEAEGRGGGQDA